MSGTAVVRFVRAGLGSGGDGVDSSVCARGGRDGAASNRDDVGGNNVRATADGGAVRGVGDAAGAGTGAGDMSISVTGGSCGTDGASNWRALVDGGHFALHVLVFVAAVFGLR